VKTAVTLRLHGMQDINWLAERLSACERLLRGISECERMCRHRYDF